MTRMTSPRLFFLLVILGMTSACSGPSTRPIAAEEVDVQTPARDLIAEVRTLAAEADDGIEVQSLRDPLVIDLRETAAIYEQAGDFSAADEALIQALALVPGDPELLQWRAELALAMRRLDDVVQLANASWELGPRLGNLCRRNWIAIRLARELSHLPDAAAAAAAQGERCTVAPPVRM